MVYKGAVRQEFEGWSTDERVRVRRRSDINSSSTTRRGSSQGSPFSISGCHQNPIDPVHGACCGTDKYSKSLDNLTFESQSWRPSATLKSLKLLGKLCPGAINARPRGGKINSRFWFSCFIQTPLDFFRFPFSVSVFGSVGQVAPGAKRSKFQSFQGVIGATQAPGQQARS